MLGFRFAEWERWTTCRRCRHSIQSGVVHVMDDNDPPDNALCRHCYEWVLTVPDGSLDPLLTAGENG